ncbi:MAG TPA: C2 family cysteine protease [Pirellulales bacterium]|nr:C2 family cysteine protease [Pirellulales bacterium]
MDSAGVVTIEASPTHDDTVNIYINHRAGNGAGNLPDLLTVSLANINTPQVAAFDPTTVTKIIFHGFGGNDFVDNRTSISMVAYGGTGNDTFFGGSGTDMLIGGSGNNYLDSRTGSSMLFGGPGTNELFGDDGVTSLYGGSGTNYIFGGNGHDYLYAGTGGANWLYGEGGHNSLIRKSAADHIFAHWGPATPISNNGVQGFDFFDHYLRDPMVRSEARYDYFRDNSLTRNDMLGIYTQIETNGVFSVLPNYGTVSLNNISDMKVLLWGSLAEPNAVRYLGNKVVFGDPANAHYQDAPLGNLVAGNPGDHLAKLVDKWFEGGDMPWIGAGDNIQYQSVSGNLFGANGPSYTDVAQGAAGDCYLIAALGEVAQHSPQTIVNMFTDNGDGTFTVEFYHNRAAVYVTVNRELPVNGNYAYFADWGAGPYTASYNTLWVALAEKAYAQLDESGWMGHGGTNSYTAIGGGGYSSDAFSQLTGASASNTKVVNWLGQSSQSDFWKAFNQHKAMTLGSKNSGTNSFIVTRHFYMVIGYDSATQSYELYNPWGYDTDAAHPAVVEETWAMIRHDFDYWTSATV